MEYEIIRQPYMLQETVAMLFNFTNGVSFKDIITRKKFFLGNEVTDEIIRRMEWLQQLMEEICSEVNPADPQLRWFFERADANHPGVSVAQLLAFSFCRIGYPGLRENAAGICRFWNESVQAGSWLNPNCGDTLLLTKGEGAPEDLFDQVFALPYAREFQIRLYRALRHVDRTMEELVTFLEPFAEKLEERLLSEPWLQSDLVGYWQEIFEKTPPREVAKEILGYETIPGHSGKTYVLPMFMNGSFVAFGEDQNDHEQFNLLILGSGATAGSHLRQQSSILDGLSSILKAISDRRRLEILCRLSHGRSYCYELAEAMGIDASNMSRHLAQLNQYGLLHQEREHMINYYETNKEALLDFLQLVGTTIMS